ncbi:GFA family protein [Defluviimonas aestuarii]|uniref:GFA family protein n=1 Tax=Albidovulum aestuarii TaxID=1130726 RepID=UPI00249B4470|nr:GFA family protein [Defluviimonas aestuarii]MDI3337387.1 GFA family protein [Defluviimonas aestuarii]
MTVSGACECGAVAYAIKDGPLHVYACHCLNCQTRSGSAFAEHAMVQDDAFDCVGSVVEFRRAADGMQFTEVFCQECHTRLYNRNSMLPGMVFLRAGTLQCSQQLGPMAHIWTSRKQAWVTLPDGIPTFEHSPSPEEFGVAVAAALERSAR